MTFCALQQTQTGGGQLASNLLQQLTLIRHSANSTMTHSKYRYYLHHLALLPTDSFLRVWEGLSSTLLCITAYLYSHTHRTSFSTCILSHAELMHLNTCVNFMYMVLNVPGLKVVKTNAANVFNLSTISHYFMCKFHASSAFQHVSCKVDM